MEPIVIKKKTTNDAYGIAFNMNLGCYMEQLKVVTHDLQSVTCHCVLKSPTQIAGTKTASKGFNIQNILGESLKTQNWKHPKLEHF